MLRAVVLTQYRRVTDGQTDGQTDGIVVASTALAMRRAVKITPLKILAQMQSSRPQKATPCAKARHTTYRSLKQFFAQFTFLPTPPNPVLCMLFSRLNTPKVSVPTGASTPKVTHIAWTN